LQSAGADEVIVLEPTHALLSLTPEQFLEQVVGQYGPAAVVEGSDFRCGQDRLGDMNTLGALGKQMGFEVYVVNPVEVQLKDQLLVTVSSSLIRWLLDHGRVEDAACCLSRSYELSGRVVAGNQYGRTMRVPTVNLDPATLEGRVVPADGVYVGEVRSEGGILYPAAISIGDRSTFGQSPRVVEAHLLGFEGDLYDRWVTLTFGGWLRDQQRFPDPVHLRQQLERDIKRIHDWPLATSLGTNPGTGQGLALN